jgi:hypothetical protein
MLFGRKTRDHGGAKTEAELDRNSLIIQLKFV